ncbi:hypothetical protein SAMN05421809_2692 [Natronorubrum daqingense]|uniref:Uncharacterized protein n=1 Tax=Natronorubrum daqingense TaxID=588898 RepID=A0A1N7ELP9_9EURY|nr:hypothetical protein SAMN05421809_2692 [Natronorubrum daqingense]
MKNYGRKHFHLSHRLRAMHITTVTDCVMQYFNCAIHQLFRFLPHLLALECRRRR